MGWGARIAMSPPLVLGLAASHNGGAALVKGSDVIVAIQEERLSRAKRARVWGARPCLSISYCMDRMAPDLLDLVAISVQGHATAPEQQLAANPLLSSKTRTLVVPHHYAHAAHAFSTSGEREAAVLVVDGMGSPIEDLSSAEQSVCRPATGWEIVSSYRATPSGLEPIEKLLVGDGKWLIRREGAMPRFRSLGGMFSAVAQQTFGDASDAGKVMGLAPYGRRVWGTDAFVSLVDGELTFRDEVSAAFDGLAPWPAHEARYRDLACSVQHALQDILLLLARRARERTGCDALCYAGGVALNGIANELLRAESGFSRIHIPPAAEDSGTAVGSAYEGVRVLTGRFPGARQLSDGLGRRYRAPRAEPGTRRVETVDIMAATVERLASGLIGGWFAGGSELGPRALGQRSILADPRDAAAKSRLNLRVKHREEFRPFAPAVLAEAADSWFDFVDGDTDSRFMLRVVPVRVEQRDRVPAIVHIDGTARPQTVTRDDAPELHTLLSAFLRATGIPMLVNTSFNIAGEPIVETPDDALWCLAATDLDFCVIEGALYTRDDDFVSVLDLVPRVIATRCRVDLNVHRGAVLLEPAPHSVVATTVDTPWGQTEQSLSLEVLPVLREVDGKRSGRAIADRLGMDESIVARELGALRRSRSIRFSRK